MINPDDFDVDEFIQQALEADKEEEIEIFTEAQYGALVLAFIQGREPGEWFDEEDVAAFVVWCAMKIFDHALVENVLRGRIVPTQQAGDGYNFRQIQPGDEELAE